ncbi:hypothetical protein I317_02171 [Kwoniella heveanensis CBS 569]|nr:hypothetical protein I317_02171 [Kwoniella heveanensis CBS 569]
MSRFMHLSPDDALALKTIQSQLAPTENDDADPGSRTGLAVKGTEIMQFEAVDEVFQQLHGAPSVTKLPPYPEELDKSLSANSAHHTKALWQLQSILHDPSTLPKYKAVAEICKDLAMTRLYTEDSLWNREQDLFPAGISRVDGPSTSGSYPTAMTAEASAAATAGASEQQSSTNRTKGSIKTQYGTVTLDEAKTFVDEHGLDPRLFSILDEKSRLIDIDWTEISDDESVSTRQPGTYRPMTYSRDEQESRPPTEQGDWSAQGVIRTGAYARTARSKSLLSRLCCN